MFFLTAQICSCFWKMLRRDTREIGVLHFGIRAPVEKTRVLEFCFEKEFSKTIFSVVRWVESCVIRCLVYEPCVVWSIIAMIFCCGCYVLLRHVLSYLRN